MADVDIEPPERICVKESTLPKAGRGVFATTTIVSGACIEQCPVVTLPADARPHLRKTDLVNYYFLWYGSDNMYVSLSLGYGSVYNHSFTPNAQYVHDPDHNQMNIYALRDIAAGEEIFINYNGDPQDTRPLRLPGIPESEAVVPVRFVDRMKDRVVRRVRILVLYITNGR